MTISSTLKHIVQAPRASDALALKVCAGLLAAALLFGSMSQWVPTDDSGGAQIARKMDAELAPMLAYHKRRIQDECRSANCTDSR